MTRPESGQPGTATAAAAARGRARAARERAIEQADARVAAATLAYQTAATELRDAKQARARANRAL